MRNFPFRLCLVVPIWRRYRLTNHLLTYYHSLDIPGIELVLVVVGSERDVSRRIARGLEYVEADNSPMDRKYDTGIEYCRRLDPDAVCLVGSDDFLTEPYFSWAVRQLALGNDLVGLLDFYLVDVPKQSVFYWGGYDDERRGEPIAAGRMYARVLLERMEWKPYWSADGYGHIHRDDERAMRRAADARATIRTANMAHVGCQFWAVKTGEELNPISAFEGRYALVGITPHSYELFRETTGL